MRTALWSLAVLAGSALAVPGLDRDGLLKDIDQTKREIQAYEAELAKLKAEEAAAGSNGGWGPAPYPYPAGSGTASGSAPTAPASGTAPTAPYGNSTTTKTWTSSSSSSSSVPSVVTTTTDVVTTYTTVCPVTSEYTTSGTVVTSAVPSLTTTSTLTTSYKTTITLTSTLVPAPSSYSESASSPEGSATTTVPAYSGSSSSEEVSTVTTSTSTETTLVPLPYGSYTPSDFSSWPETSSSSAELTTYTTVISESTIPVTSTLTLTSSSGATPITPSQTYSGTSVPYPAGNSTTVGPSGSGTGIGTGTGTGTGISTGTGVSTSSTTSSSTNSTTSSTSSQCTKPVQTDSCVPCAGQPSSNYGRTGDAPFCGYTVDDNPYQVLPQTCQTREYHFELTNITVAPDGIPRQAMSVNGQIPGPLIEANWGDWIVVHVKNSLQNNGSSIHWHGVRQNHTNEMDGVSSITQCPLAPGETQTYRFRAENIGTSWYHSHYSLQAYEGVFGPLVIHGPLPDTNYDSEEIIVLQDWSHVPLNEMYDAAQTVGPTPQNGPRVLDTGLINGVNVWGQDGAANATGERFSLTVKPGSTYLLRVISSAIQSTFKFYIDGHKFKVISADFVNIEPYETDVVSINNGQRYNLLVTFDQPVGDYWLRSDNAQECAQLTQWDNIKGIVHYEGGPQGIPTSTATNYSSAPGSGCADEPLASLTPYYKLDAGAQEQEIDKTVTIGGNGGTPNLYKWSLSGTTFQSQYGDPTLVQIIENGTVPTYSGSLAIEAPNLGEWVYLIIDSPIPFPHPIHLHGHDFYVLAQGTGTYSSDVSLNLNSPPRRDVAMMPWDPSQNLGGHLVVAFYTDNPGVWLAHCHVGWHLSMGFALQIIENLDGINKTVTDSCALSDTCTAWKQYAAANDVEVEDSGV